MKTVVKVYRAGYGPLDEVTGVEALGRSAYGKEAQDWWYGSLRKYCTVSSQDGTRTFYDMELGMVVDDPVFALCGL